MLRLAQGIFGFFVQANREPETSGNGAGYEG
jgi:hypothetical protein